MHSRISNIVQSEIDRHARDFTFWRRIDPGGHMRVFSAWITVLLAVPGIAHAQTFSAIQRPPMPSGVISGSVVDERGAPVPRMVVYAIGAPRATPDGRTIEMSLSALT